MNNFFSVIDEHLENQNLIFVFPSQVVAKSAMLYAVKKGAKKSASSGGHFFGSIATDRFLGWDEFKSNYLSSYDKNLKPCSKAHKLFFAYLVAHQNSSKPFLKQVVPADFFSESTTFISSILEAINSLFLVDKKNAHLKFDLLLEEGLYSDLQKLKSEFDQFLKENNLYELGQDKTISLQDKQKEAIIFFPHVLSDFNEYEELLATAKGIKLVGTSSEVETHFNADENLNLSFFKDAKDEAKSILLQAKESLLKNKEVVITCGSDDILNLLIYYSTLYGVKLNIREGENLSSSMEWNFFKKATEIVKSNYDFNALWEFANLNSLPFKTDIDEYNISVKESLSKIIEAGKKGNAKNTKEQWELAISSYCITKNFLQKAEDVEKGKIIKRDRLLTFWKNFTRQLEQLTSCSALDQLHLELQKFISAYIDEEGIEKNFARPRFEKILSELRRLCELDSRLAKPFKGDAISFFNDHLKGSTYVFKHGEGIDLYKYRVSAGIECDVHFVCGLDDNSTKVVIDKAPFISESQKELWRKKTSSSSSFIFSSDLTNELLRVYAFSGQEVFLSGSAKVTNESETLDKIPPFLYFSKNKIREENSTFSDPLHSLLKNKIDGSLLPFTIFNGISQYQNSTSDKKVFENILSLLNSDNLSGFFNFENDKLIISASTLEVYRKCPLRVLLKKVVAEATKNEVELSSTADEGTFLHLVMEHIANYSIDQGIIATDTNYEDGLRRLKEEAREYINSIDEKTVNLPQGPSRPLDVIWQKIKEDGQKKVCLLLDAMLEKFGVINFVQAEKAYKIEFDNYIFDGRVDAIVKDSEEKLHILDYKRELKVTAKDFFPTTSFYLDDTGSGETLLFENAKEDTPLEKLLTLEEIFKEPDSYFPTTFQMAFYQEFLFKETGSYPDCLYCDFSQEDKNKIIRLPSNVGKKGIDPVKMIENNRLLTHLFARKMSEDVARGSFALWEGLDCKYCDYDGICRVLKNREDDEETKE